MKIDLSPKHWLIGILIVIFALYVIFQARFLILGPQIYIDTPQDGETVTTAVVIISGRAYNVAWLSFNGRQIFTDESGHWEEKLIVSRGMSIMTVSARDRFGRDTEEKVRIIFN